MQFIAPRALVVALYCSAFALGQGLTGSIAGTVGDQSGAAIPDAEVSLVNINTSQTRDVKADANGDFLFTQLLPGTFRLSVSLVSGADTIGGGGAGVDSRVNLTGNPILTKSQRPEPSHFDNSVVQPLTRHEFGTGTAPKGIIRGPGQNVFDFSVYKNVPLGSNEARRLQLRFEFHNLFNHASFSGLDTNARFDANSRQVSGTFGQYTSKLDARRAVLGAKFYF